MRRPGFLSGVAAAAVLALAGSIGTTAMAPVVGFALLYKLLVPALGLAYVLYLFSCSRERTGRVTTLTLWALMAATAWVFEPSIGAYLSLHLIAIWLIRSLYFYSSAFSALLDLGLSVLAVASAYWAAVHSGSVLLTIWSFFLVQALFVLISPVRGPKARKSIADTENFKRARLRAEAALRQLCAK